MAEFAPVLTLADFRQLDDGEVLAGYFDGFHGRPPPGSHRSRSFWHGWRNGRIDAGYDAPGLAHRMLEQAFQLTGTTTTGSAIQRFPPA